MRFPALIVALALIASGASAPAATPGPDALVRDLYRQKSIPTTPAQVDRFFSHDLAAAIQNDIAGGEVGETNDRDYRYDAQDMRITGLTFTSKPVVGAVLVTARFKNYGMPGKVTYVLCERVSDWRIADVQTKSMKMRAVLKLPAQPVRC